MDERMNNNVLYVLTDDGVPFVKERYDYGRIKSKRVYVYRDRRYAEMMAKRLGKTVSVFREVKNEL